MVYADVEIRIGAQHNNRYPVEITVNREQEYPPGSLDATTRPPEPSDAQYANAAYGTQLFSWFLADPQLMKNWAEIRGAFPHRRVRLRIAPTAPELHQVPWEALCEPPEAGLPQIQLAAASATPFSRYLTSKRPHGTPIVRRPIKILVVAPAQIDFAQKYPPNQYPGMASIDPAHEFRALQAALQPLIDHQAVELTLLPQPCTLAAIASTLMQGYHILHLICHGEYSASSGQARLILADTHNCVQPERDAVIVQTLAQQLTDARMHQKDQLRLVFLATCESARRSSADAYRGLAPGLVDAGIPAVVAMQGQVGEQTARAFAATFYRQVLDHGQVDRAANEARNLIMAAGLPGPVIPVLFLRLTDGQLFATQQFAPLERVIFDGLIAEYIHLFAGREAELARLEQFMAEPGGGYLVVQAGAGLGKTALIASLVARHHDAVAYHFFTPRIPESLQEATFLRSLLEQISPWYKQPVPPTRQPEELRKHYDALLGQAPDGSHTVILDGLDEVTGWDLARYLARSLPPGLHVMLTMRDTVRDPVLDFALPAGQVRSLLLTGLTREGVRAVLQIAGGEALRFAEDDEVLDQVLRVTTYDDARPQLGADTLFVRFLAEDAAAGKLRPARLARMPAQMEVYLDRWWRVLRAEFGEEGERRKRQQAMVDLAGTLAAALGPIGPADLEALNPSLVSEIEQDFVATVVQAVQRIVVQDSHGDYTLLHPRLRQYLRQKLKTGRYVQRLLRYCAQWRTHRSRYALRYYAAHLAEAASAANQPERHAQTEKLVSLVTNRQFQDTHLDVVNDLAGLQADLQRGLEIVASDDAPEALPLLVGNALALVRFRRERLRPAPIFAMAARGDIAGARRMLALFELDARWHQVALLTIAWLAGAAEEAEARRQARALREEIATALAHLSADDQRRMLLRWIEADLEGTAPPDWHHQLPPAPHIEQVRQVLAVAAGVSAEADMSPELLFSLSGINQELLVSGSGAVGEIDAMSEEMFLAYYLGPLLVAAARADPQHATSPLQEYLRFHATYVYADYRFGSLWALLRAILQHSEPAWIRAMVRDVLITGLGGGSAEYEEGLSLMVLALTAPNEAAAEKRLARYVKRVGDEARQLSPTRGRSDTWGRYKRLLGGMAEAEALLGAQVGATSREWLLTALTLPYGYAGYQAPACLTLAEAIRICQPAEAQDWIQRSLTSAQQAAHNVQEGAFCARTTARVNALRTRWWPQPALPVREAIQMLRTTPRSERFAALHYVGEPYAMRGQPPQSFPLPRQVLNADTLNKLAAAYQRGLPEFQRLNRDWQPDTPIPDGTLINVPDPGMAPLLAARLAAEALVAPELDPTERITLIRALVSVAATNPTTLDTVLARLLLAAQPSDPTILRRLAALVPLPAAAAPATERLEP